MNAQWISQLVPPMGAIKAEGVKGQIGRPTLESFVVLVREAAQNSWDAADPSYDGPVRFAMDLKELDPRTTSAWRDVLSPRAPAAGNLPLRSTLAADSLSILFVSDRGTDGLGGPTRADQAREGEPHDYVSFALNVGDPRDTALGGGTYGFGKAVFFLASAASTILVHTRCRGAHGEAESRLVGCALGKSFDANGDAYTGRHWFGLPTNTEIVAPVVGEAADEIARRLGFPPFEGGELGTTIAVIAPELDGQTPEAVVARLAHAVLWHLWPKMVDRGGGPDMEFRVARNSLTEQIPDPAIHPALSEFVAALQELEDCGETISYGAASQPVGQIRLRTTFAPPPAIDEVGQEAGFKFGVRHCCLLRAPELVVEYLEGPQMPDDNVWYAGVFKVFPEHDEIFARAEPPTHDSWSPQQLEDRERSLVRTTLRKIEQKLRSYAAPGGTESPTGSGEGLAGVSRMLGALLAPAPGQAAGPSTRHTNGGRRKTRIRMLGAPTWTQLEGRDVLAQSFEVVGTGQITVDAETTVRVWGGAGKETEPPLGSAEPELLGWRDPDGNFHRVQRIGIGAGEEGTWEAIVAPPTDTVTRIRVREATG